MLRLNRGLPGARPRPAVPRGRMGLDGPGVRLRYILILVGLIFFVCWESWSIKSVGASEAPLVATPGWSVNEIPVATGPGDQITPAVDGGKAVYNDLNRSASGWVVLQDLFDGRPEAVAGAGVFTGPDIDGGYIAWQNANSQVCRRPVAGGTDQCLSVSKATTMALSGNRVITSHTGISAIRAVDFGSMSSKILDSYNFSGYRYGPDIDGNESVWVRERGYAGKYYEPVLFAYNLKTDVSSYLTKTGGGVNSTGAGKYARQHPTMGGGRVIYQQKLNESGASWDIYEAVPDTFGTPLVEQPGDQANPSMSGNLIVYQDNRTGHLDDTGRWTGEWNIYLKDLSTGIEQPICTAPGDQINPVIKGDTVIWQDNRDGNWDVYAAVLSPALDDLQLAQQYSPSLVMHHNEDFRPEDAGVMVSAPGSALMEDGIERLRAPETLTLDALGDYGAGAYLDLPGKCLICGLRLPDPGFDRVIRTQYVHSYAAVLASGGHDEVVYSRVVPPGGRTVIQYWINYYFNNHPMLSHEGDWELIEVELDAGLQPSRVSVSQHGYGKMRQWRDVEVRDGHPVLYVGRGSHTNYFEPGDHAIEITGLPNPLVIDEVDACEDGSISKPTVLPLPESSLDLPGYRWLQFRGRWGEVNGLSEADPPAGPVWSGDRWEHPFAWQGLEWDGFSGLGAKFVGLEARVNSSVRISLTDGVGRVGENLLGEVERSIPGSQFLDVTALGQKAVRLPGTRSPFACRLEINAAQNTSTPVQLSFSDPARGTIISLDYGSVTAGPGIVAWLAIGPGSEGAGYAIQIDEDGDGFAERAILPDSVANTDLDITEPAAVGDLRAERQKDGAIKLAWTASGDDGNEGAAILYSVRYSAAPITEQNWAAAEPVTVTMRPRTAGEAETLMFNDLPPDSIAYFAVKVTDEAGNESALSNLANTVQPRLALSVGSVFWRSYADYLTGRLTVWFRLSNNGGGPATNVAIEEIVTSPATVIPATMPPPLATLDIGQSANLEVPFYRPAGIYRFTSRVYASCRDATGGAMWFPGPPPGRD